MTLELFLLLTIISEALVSASLLIWGWKKQKNVILLANSFSRLYVAAIYIWVLIDPNPDSTRIVLGRFCIVVWLTLELLSFAFSMTIGKKK